MTIINKVREFLSGKKTYIVGLLMIVLGILEQNEQLILEGITVVFLRAGISKIK